MGDEQVKIVKRKVKAYPFPAILDQNGVKKPVEIIYVGQAGVIASLNVQFVNVGEYYQVSFELPTLGHVITAPVRVLKTYDRALDTADKKVERLAEFHFQKLTKEDKGRITSFMTAIGQKK